MGSKTNRKSKSTKTRSSTSKKNIRVRQAAKKMNEKFSKDRSEHVRDALNRDVNLLYSPLKNPSTAQSPIPQADSVASLAESMRGLGK